MPFLNYSSHLLLEEVSIAAGEEWSNSAPAWQVTRLQAGQAFWLGPTESKDLAVGDVILLAPGNPGCIRASQITPAQLHTFCFDPARLGGLLTMAQRQFFDARARTMDSSTRVWTARHPVSEEFSALVSRAKTPPRFAERAQMFVILGMLFDEDLARHVTVGCSPRPAAHRFQQLMARLPEGELIHGSHRELAKQCGCTTRHFSRLFRRQFGIRLRVHQTELRLQTASQLLVETESKIIDVALESGYRNLSLFNALFKQRYRMTPSAWRRKSWGEIKKHARAAAAALLWAAIGLGSAVAAVPPNSGEVPAGTNAPVTFPVTGYNLNGNTLLPGSITGPLLAKHTDPSATFETVRQALADLQMAYRQRGYISVAVALPPQQLTNGIVQVQITEGRLDEITIRGTRYFSSNNVRRALPSLRTNSILNSLVFQQELDRANANRDRQIYPVINPGLEPGTSSLELTIKDRLPLHVRFELDNYSTPQTPELRANIAAQYNNLWGLEHQLGVQYSFSPEDYKQGSPNFFDRPLIANYSAFYRLPLSPVNGPPRENNYELSDFGYDEVTHRFRPPQVSETSELIFYASRSFSDTGRLLQSQTLTPTTIPPEGALQVRDEIFSQSLNVNENVGARWSLPLPDFWSVHSSLSLGPDFKNFRLLSSQDRTFRATIFVPEVGQTGPPFTQFPSPPTLSQRSLFHSLEYLPLTLLWEGSARDKWGSTSFTLSQSANYGGLLGNADDFRAVAGSAKANGSYYLVQAGITREQKLIGDWGLRMHADGQWANQPLISNEQFALGGAAGVRGYRDGEEYGDTGWRAQLEPHTPVLTVGVVNNVPVTARLFTFIDYGERYLLDPGSRSSSIIMLGSGGGLDCTIGTHVDFRILAGVPILDVPGRSAGATRVNFSVSAQF